MFTLHQLLLWSTTSQRLRCHTRHQHQPCLRHQCQCWCTSRQWQSFLTWHQLQPSAQRQDQRWSRSRQRVPWSRHLGRVNCTSACGAIRGTSTRRYHGTTSGRAHCVNASSFLRGVSFNCIRMRLRGETERQDARHQWQRDHHSPVVRFWSSWFAHHIVAQFWVVRVSHVIHTCMQCALLLRLWVLHSIQLPLLLIHLQSPAVLFPRGQQ